MKPKLKRKTIPIQFWKPESSLTNLTKWFCNLEDTCLFIKCMYLLTRQPVYVHKETCLCAHKSHCRLEICLAWFPTSVNGHWQMPRSAAQRGSPRRMHTRAVLPAWQSLHLGDFLSQRQHQHWAWWTSLPLICLIYRWNHVSLQASTNLHGSMFHSLSAGHVKKYLLCCDYNPGWFYPFFLHCSGNQ